MSNSTTKKLVDRQGELTVVWRDGMLHVTVRPTQGTSEWTSPLLTLEVIDRMQDRTTSFRTLHLLRLSQEDQGIHAILSEKNFGITLGVWVNWVGGELSVIVAPSEIEEADPDLYRVHSVMLLPNLMRVGADGRMLLPVNTGVICSPAGKAAGHDRFLMYGEQERWELVPMLPVCGIESPQGGIVCLARQGACDTWCDASMDGKGQGAVAFGAMFRRTWIDPVDWTEREYRYQFLAPKDDLIHAAARRVRRHVLEDHRKPTLAQRAAESQQCAYQQSAYTMKLFHGIQSQGIMMQGQTRSPDEPLFRRAMTFKQAEENLRRLRAAGLERVYLQSVGWNPRGHDGAWPTCFPIDRRLGGESGLRQLIQTSREAGYQITTHMNFGMACFNSPEYVPDHVLHDIWGQPKVTGEWGGGIHSTHWGLALPEEFLLSRLRALRAMGFDGMQYLDFQGNPLYVNYHPRHGGPRADFAAGIRRYQIAATQIFGAAHIEMGFLYCATHCDATVGPYYQPFSPWALNRMDWPVIRMIDSQVPVYALAMHDMITQEQQGLEWRSLMNAVLFGRVMRDEWSAEQGVMPVLTDQRIARIKTAYDLVTTRFGKLVTQQLVRWERLADKVERTQFADGTTVEADFNQQRLTVDGEVIEQPASLLSGSGHH